MSKIKKQDAFLAKTFYDSMIAIPSEQKSDDIYAKTFYKTLISNHFFKQKEVWEICNSNMTEGNVALPENISDKKIIIKDNVQFSFSEIQQTKIAELIFYASNSQFIKLKIISYVKDSIKRVFPKSITKKLVRLK